MNQRGTQIVLNDSDVNWSELEWFLDDWNASLKSACIMLVFLSVGGWSESVPVSM